MLWLAVEMVRLSVTVSNKGFEFAKHTKKTSEAGQGWQEDDSWCLKSGATSVHLRTRLGSKAVLLGPGMYRSGCLDPQAPNKIEVRLWK